MRVSRGLFPSGPTPVRRAGRLLPVLLASLLAACGPGGGERGTDVAGAALAAPSLAATAGIELFVGALGGPGNVDGTGVVARFNSPAGFAIAADGTIYVADPGNRVIRKVTAAGVVTTHAGKTGVSGVEDGALADARFRTPTSVAFASDGSLYVADRDAHVIRKISPGGVVSTFAGAPDTPGMTDATGTAARFDGPHFVAVAPDDTVYVSDTFNHRIRKITPAGEVTTLAGSSTSGADDGTGTAATFNLPLGLAVDGSGTIYVADGGSSVIRKITPAGVVTTLAGTAIATGSADGTGSGARFLQPYTVAVNAAGTLLYVADTGNHTIREVTAAGVVTTLAGTAGESGSTEGTGAAARFNTPAAVGFDPGGGLVVTDSYNNTLRRISLPGATTSLIAGRARNNGAVDDTGAAARFQQPAGIALASNGDLLIADVFNHTLRRATPAGVVTTVAGEAGVPGSINSNGTSARFNTLQGVAIDVAGNIYVADAANHLVRKVAPDNAVTTLVGSPGVQDTKDGTGSAAHVAFPWAMALDIRGDLYLVEAGGHVVRRITPAGVATTLAGTGGVYGSADGTGSVARFLNPRGIAIDGAGTIYVSDLGNNTIRKVTRAGVVTTLAGKAGEPGHVDGPGATARFDRPEGLATDAAGNLYVVDTGNAALRKVTPAGDVTTLAGTPGSKGVITGALPGVLSAPLGIAIGLDGELYVSDEDAVLKVTLDTPVSIFDVRLEPTATTVYRDTPFTLYWRTTDATNCVASGDWSNADLANPRGGALTVTPASTGTLNYTLTCDEAGGTGTVSRTATVTVTLPPPTVTFSASASRIDPGQGAILTWSVANADTCTASSTAGSEWTGARSTSGGTQSVTPAVSTTYTLSCTGLGGTTTRTAALVVAYVPTLTLAAHPRRVVLGDKTRLDWESNYATTCIASGNWTGAQALSGSLTIKPGNSTAQSYTLTCSGPGGTVQKTATVTVIFATATEGSGGGGGGALGVEWLLGGAALAWWRRRLRRATA